MCGICGLWNLNGQAVSTDILLKMNNLLRHRGPDDEGYVLVDASRDNQLVCRGQDTASHFFTIPSINQVDSSGFNLALAHRRLSILDLSPAGHQPMVSADGKLWVVYNGEVYNYIELRAELQQLGYHFQTATDTEVILAAYDAWGVDCLNRFNGMFAFALWDANRQQLFCARDRFGIKPFYYWFNGHRFAFASEIKALAKSELFDPTPNAAIIYDYLACRVVEHSPETFFGEVKKLPPAHYLILNQRGQITLKQWWNIEKVSEVSVKSGNETEQLEQFLWLLQDSIRLRLRSDVPVGTCLSGGLDSSTIVCLANELMFKNGAKMDPTIIGERQKTFSVGFDDPSVDERDFIKLVTAKTNVDAHYVLPDQEELWQDIGRLIWHQDEPFLSTGIYGQWRVMNLAAQNGVTVLLDGQGADELLAGYPPYLAVTVAELIRKMQWGQAINKAKENNGSAGQSWQSILARGIFVAAPFEVQLWFRKGGELLGTSPLETGVQPDFAQAWQARRTALNTNTQRLARTLSERLIYDLTVFNLPQLLRYEDRNSMAFSIESRVPFLDYRLVEFAASLPGTVKIKDGWTKWILRQATVKVLPEEIRWRRDKKGYSTPETTWLRQSRDKVENLFSGAEVMSEQFINPGVFLNNLDDMLMTEKSARDVWRMVNLELWLCTFWGKDAN